MALRDNSEEQGGGAREEDVPNVKGTQYNRHVFQDPRRISTFFFEVKNVFLEIRGKHEKSLLITANILVVLIVSVFLTKLFSGCGSEPEIPEGDSIVCREFTPVDHIEVEMDLNKSSHCYSSQSCVALGGALRQEQGGYRYNFIIGAFGFVFNELGYKCRVENSSSLHIRLPVESIYRGDELMVAHKAAGKMVELIREGLECGLVLPNYTMVAAGCGRHDAFCSEELQKFVTELSPDKVAVGEAFYDDNDKDNLFNPLDIRRAYNNQYKLVVCQDRHK